MAGLRADTVERLRMGTIDSRPGTAASGGVLIPSLCPNLNFELF
jgi:hypothetical protein